MGKIHILIFSGIVVSSFVFTYAQVQGKKVIIWPKILLIGDSMTEFAVGPFDYPWSAMLSQDFHRIADIVNRGYDGYTTRKYKDVLDKAFSGLDAEAVAAVVIALGTNDARRDDTGVRLDDFINNYKWMISRLESFGVDKSRMILVAPPPVYPHTGNLPEDPDVQEADLRQYVESILDLAKQMNITSLDLHTVFSDDPRGRKLFRSDGEHPAYEAAQLIHDHLLPLLMEKVIAFKGKDKLINFTSGHQFNSFLE